MADSSPKGQCSLPLSRVKTIMKSSPDVSNIGLESLFLVAKSAVSFKPAAFLKLEETVWTFVSTFTLPHHPMPFVCVF